MVQHSLARDDQPQLDVISPSTYQALRSALPTLFWFKKTFEHYLRAAVRSAPYLLDGVDFTGSKRAAADVLVDRLVAAEALHGRLTHELIRDVISMDRFPELEELDEAARLVHRATTAVATLRVAVARDRQALARGSPPPPSSLTSRLAGLRQRFLELRVTGAADPHRRGQEFEVLVHDLFDAFDLQPRLAYRVPHEQIDGAFTFDSDDYIVEVRWRRNPLSRADADAFAAKVRRKGKNALGLVISINGLGRDAIAVYSTATPFISMDGSDLMAVLDERIRLDRLLSLKRRHANITGSCHLPLAEALRHDQTQSWPA